MVVSSLQIIVVGVFRKHVRQIKATIKENGFTVNDDKMIGVQQLVSVSRDQIESFGKNNDQLTSRHNSW
jgi:NRPS condensation-like uncharacterized protein